MDRQLMNNMQRAFPSYIRLINLINCSSSDRFAKGMRKTFSSRGLEIPGSINFLGISESSHHFAGRPQCFSSRKLLDDIQFDQFSPHLSSRFVDVERNRTWTESTVPAESSSQTNPSPCHWRTPFLRIPRETMLRAICTDLSSTSIFSCIQDRLKKYTLIGYFSIWYTLSEFRYN